jgi:hypothetical protein
MATARSFGETSPMNTLDFSEREAAAMPSPGTLGT